MKIETLEPKERMGLVVVLTGYGKGKTTSAMGMLLRASGHGMKSAVIQFMKGDLYSGEWDGVGLLGGLASITSTGKGFCGIQGNPYSHAEHRENAQQAVDLVLETMKQKDLQLLILDEINNALQLGLIDLVQLHDILDKRPHDLHLVLTGRDAHPELIHRADTVSEVTEIKHAYRQGIEPQPGVDF